VNAKELRQKGQYEAQAEWVKADELKQKRQYETQAE
jgi:hypothetical protein